MASIVRYAIAVASSFENAARMVGELVSARIQLEHIAVVGEEKSFACAKFDCDMPMPCSNKGVAEPNAGSKESARLLSLGQVAHEILPGWAMRSATALRNSLERWLAPAHARQLTLALDEGAFLVWVELKTEAEEQHTTRCLLRAGQGGVAIHDFFLA